MSPTAMSGMTLSSTQTTTTIGFVPSAPTPELHRLRMKARNELGEKDDLIPLKIAEVRDLIAAEGVANVPPKKYDYYILRCLRARKYNVERAAKIYKKFCHLHHHHKDIAKRLTPTAVQGLLIGNFVGILNSRDPLGRHMVFIRLKNWDAYDFTLDDVLASLLLCLEQAVDDVDTQYNGIVILVDFKGFGFSHAKQATPSRIQAIVSIVQDSFPARFKEIHFYNHTALFNMCFAVAKPFLKEKIRKRIYFHGYDLTSVHRSIPPTLLPEYLGGKVPDNEIYDDEALAELLCKDDHFIDLREQFVLLSDIEDHGQ